MSCRTGTLRVKRPLRGVFTQYCRIISAARPLVGKEKLSRLMVELMFSQTEEAHLVGAPLFLMLIAEV
jgi:hypothetical protein